MATPPSPSCTTRNEDLSTTASHIPEKKTVLVTGGLGYIGSFVTLALLEAGHAVIVIDNLTNGSLKCLDPIELITGHRPVFHNVDITDFDKLDAVFSIHPGIDCVMHFAALKAVGQSAITPLDYYHVNVTGSLNLLRCIERHNVCNIVFSSSATVYGNACAASNGAPIDETAALAPENPYGNTKLAVEIMIDDFVASCRARTSARTSPDIRGTSGAASPTPLGGASPTAASGIPHAPSNPDPNENSPATTTNGASSKDSGTTNTQPTPALTSQYNAAILRYFNPAGAHPSGLMGEDPIGIPHNLLPLMAQVAIGRREKLFVYGNEYASRDGSAIRDYVHVLDLAKGHLLAMNYLFEKNPGVRAWNLGAGTGTTVFEMIAAFEKAAIGHHCKIKYEIAPPRLGDALSLTADSTRAHAELGWSARRSLDEICSDLWKWTKNNPDGYQRDPSPILVEQFLLTKSSTGSASSTSTNV